MGYEGQRISDFIGRCKAPTDAALVDMAEKAGDRDVEWTRMNTPVGRELQDAGPHAHLRDLIFRKDVRVYVDAVGRRVYESGAYTDVEYAPYVEEGTGLFGPFHSTYIIRPRNPGGWLSWITPDGFVRRDGTFVPPGTRIFARQVIAPGSPGNHMFAIGIAMTESEFASLAEGRLEEWRVECEAQALR